VSLPVPPAAILLPFSVGLFLAGIWLVGQAAKRWGWSAEIQRKSVHVGTGLFAMALPWLLPNALLFYGLLALTLLVMAALRLPSVASAGIGKVLHGVERKSWGDVMLVAALGTLYFYSDGASNAFLYLMPLAVLTLSDAAAAVAGSAYGRLHYTIEDGHKSLEGSIIFFLVTLVLAFTMLLLLSDVPRNGVVLLSFVTAAFATAVEADSWRGLDNYFVPVGVLLLLVFHMDSEPLTLVLLATGFVATFVLIYGYGRPLLGLSAHTSRAYTAGLFMIGAVTAWPNAIMPTLALIAQTFARRNNPSETRHPDLDMLAMLAGLSFVALLGGLALGYTAISFYGIACAAIVMQCTMLAMAHKSLVLRSIMAVGLGVVLAGGLTALVAFNTAFNPSSDRWHGALSLTVGLGLAIPAAISLVFPAFFQTARYAKVGLIGASVPLIAFLCLYLQQEGFVP
jgi:phytol kinase